MQQYRHVTTGELIEREPPNIFDRSPSWERVESDASSERDLSDLSRDELDSLARELGVDEPEKLQNKAAVVEAIEASRE